MCTKRYIDVYCSICIRSVSVYVCILFLMYRIEQSNANKFWRNSRLFRVFLRNFASNYISKKFPGIFMPPVVLIPVIFRTIIRFAPCFTLNFRVINSLPLKSRYDFSNDNPVLPKIQSVYQLTWSVFKTSCAEWNILTKARKKPLICWNSVRVQWSASYETHLVIQEGNLNCWLDPKPQNTTIPINKCHCTKTICLHLPNAIFTASEITGCFSCHNPVSVPVCCHSECSCPQKTRNHSLVILLSHHA